MIRAQELIVQAASDVLGPSDRESIALEVDEMKKEMLQKSQFVGSLDFGTEEQWVEGGLFWTQGTCKPLTNKRLEAKWHGPVLFKFYANHQC